MSLMQHLPGSRGADGSGSAPVYNARDLIPNGHTAELVLDGQVYTLRITRAGKLILTK